MVGMMPLHSYHWDSRIGGQSRDSHPTVGQHIQAADQARHIYRKVETGGIINIDTLKHEIKQEKTVELNG